VAKDVCRLGYEVEKARQVGRQTSGQPDRWAGRHAYRTAGHVGSQATGQTCKHIRQPDKIAGRQVFR
jgi:hypothetical protein